MIISRPANTCVTTASSKPANNDAARTSADMRYYPDRDESLESSATTDTNQTNITNVLLKNDNDSTENVDSQDIDHQSANADVSTTNPPDIGSLPRMTNPSYSTIQGCNHLSLNDTKNTGTTKMLRPRKRKGSEFREPAACRVKLERLTPELIAWWTRCVPNNSRIMQMPVVFKAEHNSTKPQHKVQPLTILPMFCGDSQPIVDVSLDDDIGMHEHETICFEKEVFKESKEVVGTSRWKTGGTIVPMESW